MPFQPGHRNFKMGKRSTNTGKMSDDRIAWVRNNLGQFTYFRYAESADGEVNENGPNVVLAIPTFGGRARSFNLTALTAEELEATEKFFQFIFDEARPIVAERDRVANEALESGDDSHPRVYRQLPQFVIRQRPESADSEGVHVGPEDLPEGGESDIDSDDGLRADSDQLVADESPDSSSQDVRSEAN